MDTLTDESIHSDFTWLNSMKSEVHTLAIEKGWYDDETETDARYIARAVANMHGELSELWEAFRKGTLNDPCDKHDPCDKNIPLTCQEEELADLVIRALDYAGRMKLDIGRAVRLKHAFNQTRPYRHGGKAA